MNYHIDSAIKIALRSMHKKHLTGCVIVDNPSDSIISNGWSHTGQWRRSGLYSVHAEIHALIRGKHQDLTDCTCYIACLAKKSGAITNAQPCLSCATALVGYGITLVHYTIPGIYTTTNECFTSSMFLPDAIDSAELKVYNTRES
jgi:deoxycytidylate deaminase